ncbi:MAG: hypothetical protein CEE40_09155 [Chloroflexi bacterium B3_Chlor]|nr:MAG: hypothetical protein CEE40_09155 [Chloroflexi bacterium B3_Chlor]
MTKTRVEVDQIRKDLEESCSSDSPADRETLESLVRLGEEARNVIAPVRPGAEFRQHLRDELLGVVRQRPTLVVASGSDNRRWAYIVGATLGSLVPLFGVVAYLLRSRLTGKPQHAPSQ